MRCLGAGRWNLEQVGSVDGRWMGQQEPSGHGLGERVGRLAPAAGLNSASGTRNRRLRCAEQAFMIRVANKHRT